MYVCMYVCIYVCMYDLKLARVRDAQIFTFGVSVPVCMYVCMYVCMCVCMDVCNHWSKSFVHAGNMDFPIYRHMH